MAGVRITLRNVIDLLFLVALVNVHGFISGIVRVIIEVLVSRNFFF
jgi:hypothetical protein